AFSARCLQCCRIQTAYSFTPHISRRQRGAQNHSSNRADLHDRVPTINIVTRISFRDAELLRGLHTFGEASPFLHRFENHVCRRVEDAAEAAKPRCWESLAKE